MWVRALPMLVTWLSACPFSACFFRESEAFWM